MKSLAIFVLNGQSINNSVYVGSCNSVFYLSVQSFPPFGLLDHSVLLLQPKSRTARSCSRRFVTRRDTRLSRRLELGRYRSSIDWSVVDSITGCENKLLLFEDLVKNGVDILMPLKSGKLHANDAPWVTPEFKSLIKQHQKA